MTLLFTDPVFLEHETGRHVEIPARLTAIEQRLKASGLIERCQRGAFAPLPVEKVIRIHDPAVARRAEEVAKRGGGMLDADTVVSPRSYEVALHAAGACVAAVEGVLSGRGANALCLVRPPGHHATPTHSMGFCLFNNIALAADHARAEHGVDKILIVDWDVHHGNGTQDIFYRDPSFIFLSIHRYGHGFYPGTGAADETGSGPGLGHILNVPLRYGVSRADYRAAFENAVSKAADRLRPELILLSAGFDAHAADPIGALGLEVEDFAALTRFVRQVAGTHSSGRLVSCLEGGYNLAMLAESVEAHLRELLQ
jgi:acetoin utilization deacetylase AcuC-like enzyme